MILSQKNRDSNFVNMFLLVITNFFLKLSYLICMCLVLLLAGDVERNPGPRTKKTSTEKRMKELRDKKRLSRGIETKEKKLKEWNLIG